MLQDTVQDKQQCGNHCHTQRMDGVQPAEDAVQQRKDSIEQEGRSDVPASRKAVIDIFREQSVQKQYVCEHGARFPVYDESGRKVENVHEQYVERQIDRHEDQKSRRQSEIAAQDEAQRFVPREIHMFPCVAE